MYLQTYNIFSFKCHYQTPFLWTKILLTYEKRNKSEIQLLMRDAVTIAKLSLVETNSLVRNIPDREGRIEDKEVPFSISLNHQKKSSSVTYPIQN